jgi:DNA-binding NarL/FixJ family response regulator
MKQMIKVIVVDDHPIIIKGYEVNFKECKRINLIGAATSAEKLFEMLDAGIVADVVLLDIEMPGGMNGNKALLQLKENYPDVQIIIVSTHFSNTLVIHSMRNGASSYLHKTEDCHLINEAIVSVYDNGFYHSERVSEILGDPDKSKDMLSDHEIELLLLICEGLRGKEIADKLDIKLGTVDFHKKKIFRKTGCKNSVQLGIYAKTHFLTSD